MPQDTGGILNLKKPVGSDDIRLQTIGIDLPYNFQKIDDAFTAHQAESAQKHITESGENANGSYIRFDDGTQICWKKDLTISYTNNVEYIEGTWYYPVSFISPPMALTPLITDWGSIVDYYDKISAFYAAPFATTTSYVRYILYKTSNAPGFSSGHNCKVAVMAIGRWK